MKSLALLALLAACGSDANVAGDYTISVTSRDNGCNINGWQVGGMSSGVTVTITQAGSTATAIVTGGGGFLLGGLLGKNDFTGTVDGDHVDLTVLGTAPKNAGNCTYTFNGEISATDSGDVLTGRIDYRAADNGNPDCTTMMIHGCDSYQDFNGTRPPT
jgi:hypothetical protein